MDSASPGPSTRYAASIANAARCSAVGSAAEESPELDEGLRMATEPDVRVESVGQRAGTKALQPLRLLSREFLVADVRERGAAPQIEPAAQQRRRQRGIAVRERVAPLRQQAFEAHRVDLGRVDLKHVPGGIGRDAESGREDLPQLGDVDLEKLRGGGRRVLTPQRVDRARRGRAAARVVPPARRGGRAAWSRAARRDPRRSRLRAAPGLAAALHPPRPLSPARQA